MITTEGFDAVARTALLTTALRTMETARSDRLYEDPYAHALAGKTGLALFDELARMTTPNRMHTASDGRKLPNTFDYNAIRTRFFDDWLTATVEEGGYRQVVIAAAGMDTRAYRLAWPHPVDIYEIDRRPVLDVKDAALSEYSPAKGVTRRPVPTDLVSDDWRAALTAAGFDAELPAVWLLEGLLYYIPGQNARRLLTELAEFCPPGSPVACDLVNEVALNAPSTQKLLRLFADWNSPWLFGSDEPEELFADHGFDVNAVQPGEPGAHYGRWKDSVLPRDVPGIPRVFYVYGRTVGTCRGR